MKNYLKTILKNQSILWDLVVILVLALFLTYLSIVDRMELLIKLPFISLYAAYILGRIIGVQAGRKSKQG
ncbi:MAG: hypothetical protein AB7E36_02585 [Salinivirgaceae bacterium]